ncbi:HSP20-like chaperone [Sesbania bispinosa]|nr:HSP20-like chaperone [Sesbania bispinosa]
MAQKGSHQSADRVYKDFEPSYEWAQDQESDTLILMLKGFRKENLRVQISPNRILKLSGEQQIIDNTWRQFRKEFTIPSHSDSNAIKAKLEGGFLYVRLPKRITQANPEPEKPKHDESTETPAHEESEVSQKQDQKEQASHQTEKEMAKTGADDENNVVQNKRPSPTLCGLIVEIGKQKKLANMVVIILVLVLWQYVKNVIKSYFGGSRIQEL